jgi:hypothetical protein
MAEQSTGQEQGQGQGSTKPGSARERGGLMGGLILIALGILFLADNLLPGFSFGEYWPVLLIVIGVGLLLRPRWR